MATTTRLEFRLRPESKELIEQAAQLLGMTVSEFANSRLVQLAEQIIAEHNITRLTNRDRDIFLAMLEADSKPTRALAESLPGSEVTMSWVVEKLSSDHHRESFDCGKELLNNFLKRLATQYRKKNLGQTYVVATPDKRVIGYYTVSTSRVAFDNVPEDLRRQYPQIPIPVVLLGRLAVDKAFRGQGVGETLLVKALRQAAEVAETLGIAAVEVHALDDDARSFYLKYGFTSLIDDQNHLYLPIRTIKRLLEQGKAT